MKNMTILQFNIIIKRVVHAFNMEVLLLPFFGMNIMGVSVKMDVGTFFYPFLCYGRLMPQ